MKSQLLATFTTKDNLDDMLMVTNSDGLNKINTRIYKIEKVN